MSVIDFSPDALNLLHVRNPTDDKFKRMVLRALYVAVRQMREDLYRIQNPDPKEPNYKAKMEMRIKIIRTLGELGGFIKIAEGKAKPKRTVPEVQETGGPQASAPTVTVEEIEERKRRIAESRKKLDRTGTK